jgi:hypothetical protein
VRCGSADSRARCCRARVGQLERELEHAVALAAPLDPAADQVRDLRAGQRAPLAVQRRPPRLDVIGAGNGREEAGIGHRRLQPPDRAPDKALLRRIGATNLAQGNGEGHRA